MTVEKEHFVGTKSIVEKITSIPINMNPKVYDAQPCNNGILIFLSGTLVIQGESNEINFVRVFFLGQNNSGGFYSKCYLHS